MLEIQRALAELGLAWRDVWVLTADRRAGTLVVVARDGRKMTAALVDEPVAPAAGRPQRVKAIKEAPADSPR